MASLIHQNGDQMSILRLDTALRLAKKLTKIVRGELGNEDFKLHMAHKVVARGLGCPDFHAMTTSVFPRMWNGEEAIDRLTGFGFFLHENTAVEAIDLLEENVASLHTVKVQTC